VSPHAARAALCLLASLSLAGCASEPVSEPVRASEACVTCEKNSALCECKPTECCAEESQTCDCCRGAVTEPKPTPTPSEPEGGPSYVNKGPAVLDPAEVGIGAIVDDAQFVDLKGEVDSLRALAARAPATVVLFTSLGCPVTKAYAPNLEALTRVWRKRGVKVLVLDPAILDTPAKLRAWSNRHGWTFRLALDRAFAVTAALGGRRTADAFLLDREAKLRYRGPIDDQYGINLRLPEPRHHLLSDALDALLAGEEIKTPALEAPGCKITRVQFDEDDE
jgi:peroxiredoxin